MKQALIIGATGGIGAALATEVESRGFAVTTLGRSRDGFDVTRPETVDAALQALAGPFDLIAVAMGILAPADRAPEKSLSQIDAAQMAEVFAVNSIGPALILRHVARLLAKDRPAACGILSARVGSIGDNKVGGWHSYRASKAALNQIIRGAAIELGRSHKPAVCVALHPGTVNTNFSARYPGHDKLAPATAAAHLIDVLTGLTPADTGGFYDYAGTEVPW